MKKLYVSIIVILLIISSIASVTYAWFTYVERKSLATFEAGELSIKMRADDAQLDYHITINDLAFIDFENELILDKYNTFNHMATQVKIDIISDQDAPLSRHLVSIDQSQLIDGLIYIIIYEGMNNEDTEPLTSDYHTYISQIIDGYSTKEDQLNAISLHNQEVIELMYQEVLKPNDKITFQIVLWGDYDQLETPEQYLDETFTLTLIVASFNDKKGDVIS